MAKFSNEQKLEAVLGVLEEGLSHQKAGRWVGATSKALVRNWVRMYKEHGIEGLSMQNFTYDGQFKIDVIEYYEIFEESVIAAAPHYFR